MKPIRLIRGFFTVGGWTMASRVLGFARDVMIASVLGAGPVAEAFWIAFSLPNMFRRFFAEGAFNTAFVPIFSEKVEKGTDPVRFASDAFSALGSILILFTLVASVFMPALVFAMASGFLGDDRFDLTVLYGRISFGYILFISLAALCSGVLNTIGRFAAAAAAPVLLNVILVATLFLAQLGAFPQDLAFGSLAGEDLARANTGTLLSWGVLVGGVGQLALVWFAAARAGFRIRVHFPKITPDLIHLAKVAAPAMLAGGVLQINLLVGRQVASFSDGAIAWIGYADRLYQLPLGVVGIAVAVVLLPDLSRRLAAKDDGGARWTFNRANEISLALTLPAAAALVAMPTALVSVLYQRGSFTAEDTQATALAVALYGLGLPAFVLQKVFQPLFFARQDTKTPFRYAVVAMVVNAVIAIAGSLLIGWVAAVIASTISAWVMVWLLMRGSRPMGEVAQIDDRFRRRIWRICLSSAIMAVVLVAGAWLLGPALVMGGWRYLALAGLVALGIVTYFVAAHVTNALRLSEIRSAMRRGH
ncbi:murein biosynthesis integral membrane protein MurJ [Chachezhania sediminis]|uniref:murein biosynthesis integral membrane protein MurJ n=1 Tax=Chachezhania sediminis TaxID=2599291 RepID=UPI00131E6E87|nr:murein biosynthesis integral membrane protein MurJ [Chachezhania sediminis]